ncbi:hypothetical protein ES703_83839 [subsurface metagenome]
MDGKNKQIDFCKYGDDVKIVCEILFKETVKGPIFGIMITDPKNNTVYGTNTRLNNMKTGWFKKGDLAKVIYKQKVNLIGGEYYITLAVGYSDNKTYCDWVNNIATINVINKNMAEGIADLDSKISLEKINKKK